jgi:hypothetical protein
MNSQKLTNPVAATTQLSLKHPLCRTNPAEDVTTYNDR